MIRTLANSLKIVSIVLLTLAVAGGSVWFFNYWVDREQPMNVGRSVVVTVAEEDTPADVAEKLQDADLIAHPWYFENRMRFGGVQLKPGTYNLKVGMSTVQILDTITEAAVDETGEEDAAAAQEGPVRDQFDVTFIEGQRIEQNAVVLEEAAIAAGGQPGSGEEYIRLAQDIDYWRDNYEFLADVPADGTLEGFLFPTTFTVPANAAVEDVIHFQLQEFERQAAPNLSAYTAQGLSIYEAVTLASIVEREAAVAIERPSIAEVYLNRIEQDWNLNADPANQYGVGTEADWWPRLDTALLEQSKSTPYDTYNNTGLPPGPISNPGSASLQAVAQPTDDGYMFFVIRGDGSQEHVFTYTLEEHEAATCRENPDWEQCQ